MNRSRVGWAGCFVLAFAALGCAGLQRVGRLQTPQGQRLYVPVFVDETQEGQVGVILRDALRHAIFMRDPERYCASFDRDCWAFDGTVVSLHLEHTDRAHKAILETHVRLVGHSRGIELGRFRTEHVFQNNDNHGASADWEMSLAKKAAFDILQRLEKRAHEEVPHNRLGAAARPTEDEK